MSEQLSDGGPAFPMPSGAEPRVNKTTHYNEGMSLRDYFAGQALSGLCANGNAVRINGKEVAHERAAWILADAMLAARGQQK